MNKKYASAEPQKGIIMTVGHRLPATLVGLDHGAAMIGLSFA